jgi:TonB family protein
MTNRRPIHRLAGALVLWVVLCASASAQDALSKAKGFYASADYEQALQELETLKGQPSNTEASAYQVFCLVALGRRDEARVVVETIVRADPLFRPSEAQAPPRIRAFYDDVRKLLLAEVMRESYARAKATFNRKEWPLALVEFDRIISLTDEIGVADPSAADLRTLASGFRELTVAALSPAPAPKPEVPAVPARSEEPRPPSAMSVAPAIYGAQDTNVTPPVAISERLPAWRPDGVEARMAFSGDIELVIGEDGRVLSASIVKSVNPRYDGQLLDAAKLWTFQPATKDGAPVKFRFRVTVNLGK